MLHQPVPHGPRGLMALSRLWTCQQLCDLSNKVSRMPTLQMRLLPTTLKSLSTRNVHTCPETIWINGNCISLVTLSKSIYLHRLKRVICITILQRVHISIDLSQRSLPFIPQSSVLLETSMELSELRLPHYEDRGKGNRDPQLEAPWQEPRHLQRPSLHPEPQSQPITRATVLHQVDSTLQSNMTGPARTRHNLLSTRATNINTSGIDGPPQHSDTNLAPAVRRWIEKPMREQPAATVAHSIENDYVGGKTGANCAAARTDEREGNMTVNL